MIRAFQKFALAPPVTRPTSPAVNAASVTVSTGACPVPEYTVSAFPRATTRRRVRCPDT